MIVPAGSIDSDLPKPVSHAQWASRANWVALDESALSCLSLGERMISEELALRIVDVWLATPFEGGRHIARIRKLDVLE